MDKGSVKALIEQMLNPPLPSEEELAMQQHAQQQALRRDEAEVSEVESRVLRNVAKVKQEQGK